MRFHFNIFLLLALFSSVYFSVYLCMHVPVCMFSFLQLCRPLNSFYKKINPLGNDLWLWLRSQEWELQKKSRSAHQNVHMFFPHFFFLASIGLFFDLWVREEQYLLYFCWQKGTSFLLLSFIKDNCELNFFSIVIPLFEIILFNSFLASII